MADKAPNHKKNKTGKRSPPEVDHTDPEKFLTDDISDKLSRKKTGDSNQYIYKYRKDCPAGYNMEQAAVKSRYH